MAENFAGTPLSIASQRLKQKKENVVEQLKCAEEFVSSLCFHRDKQLSRLDEECNSVESETNLVRRILEDKKVAILEELSTKRKERLEDVSAIIELVNVAISKTNKVRSHCVGKREFRVCLISGGR